MLLHGPFTDDAAAELVVLGSVLGDAIAHTLGMEWVVYKDDGEGDDQASFALAHPDKQVFAFPQDMLIKRAESGKLRSISEVYAAAIEALATDIKNPDVAER